MNTQHSNEMKSIRKKLLAAIAMLLVAVIMTVSSTYAWFTLSTAPEVKGITTTVGANGNLEIALGTYGTVYGTVDVAAKEGDSMDKEGKDVKEANITWGNLVDLSNGYGFDVINLYPTRLNATVNAENKGLLNAFQPLKFAEYGTDGRVVVLKDETTLGKLNNAGNGFETKTPIDFAGVNAIGSVSDMSPRVFAERNYRNAIDSFRIAAASDAKTAISLYAGDLAALALDNQSSADTVEISADKIEILKNLITKLESSNQNIEASLKSASLLVLTCLESINDNAWEIIINYAEGKTVRQLLNALQNGSIEGVDTVPTIPSQITDVITKQEEIAAKLSTARTTLDNAVNAENNDTVYTWGEVKSTVSGLLKASDIKLNGYAVNEVKNSYNSDDKTIFNAVFDDVTENGIRFTFGEDSGIFADIAEMTGAYNTSIKFPTGYEVEGIQIGKKPYPVDVESRSTHPLTGDPLTESGDLGFVYSELKDSHVPEQEEDANTVKALTDTYGYTVDMLFRTNATDSQLQLQTEAANRIYESNENESLMGGGSNMSFTLGGEYNAEKIEGLARGIRVVFYESTTTTAEILAVATLDATGTTIGDQHKINLKLHDFTISGEEGTAGKITIGDEKADASICALSANVAKKITALVYLDGDVIDNSNIGVMESLNAKLNLQFSSSAALKPMDNNTLMNTVKE